MSVSGDLVGSEPTFSFTEKVDAVHKNGEVDPLQNTEDSDDSSSETNGDGGNLKIKAAESKPSTSQEVTKFEGDTLLDSIVEIFEMN